MRQKFLLSLGLVLGASMAAGEVTIRSRFMIDGIVTSVDDHEALHLSAAEFDYQIGYSAEGPKSQYEAHRSRARRPP